MSGFLRRSSARPRSRRAFSRQLLIGLFLLVLLLVLNASVFLVYRRVRGQIEEELGERLLAIAVAAAAAIDGSRGPGLQSGTSLASAPADTSMSAADRELRAFLQRVRLETRAGDVYIIDTEHRRLIDVDGRRPAGDRDPALELHYAPITAALAGVPAASGLYKVGDVYLRTAFAPIYDHRGTVTGVLAAVGGAGLFVGVWELRLRVLIIGAAGMALMLAIAGLFLRMLRTQAATERALRETAALAAASELAAILAHEIRNPLTIISSRAERVAAKIAAGRPAAELLEWFSAIPREIERLDRILGQYLGFARPRGAEAETTRLGSALEAALSFLSHDLERCNIDVTREDAQAGDLRVAIPPAALHQILLNILLNARDAMDAGGRLEIRARPAPRSVALSIADTGRGMNAEQRRRAFDLFYTTKPKGSGLGLAVVRSMCDLYGIAIAFESEVGRGTRFALQFPLAAPAGADEGAAP